MQFMVANKFTAIPIWDYGSMQPPSHPHPMSSTPPHKHVHYRSHDTHGTHQWEGGAVTSQEPLLCHRVAPMTMMAAVSVGQRAYQTAAAVVGVDGGGVADCRLNLPLQLAPWTIAHI